MLTNLYAYLYTYVHTCIHIYICQYTQIMKDIFINTHMHVSLKTDATLLSFIYSYSRILFFCNFHTSTIHLQSVALLLGIRLAFSLNRTCTRRHFHTCTHTFIQMHNTTFATCCMRCYYSMRSAMVSNTITCCLPPLLLQCCLPWLSNTIPYSLPYP